MPIPRFEVPSGVVNGVNTSSKRCSRCHELKKSEDFGVDRHRKDGRSAYCLPCAALGRREWASRNKARLAELDAEKRTEWCGQRFEEPVTRATARNRLIRLEVLNILGGCCACCGENREEFLTLDHVSGGGRKHREEKGTYIFRRVKDEPDLRKKYRVLCFNCNCALGLRGYCPHMRRGSDADP